jgi:hypothetical protein
MGMKRPAKPPSNQRWAVRLIRKRGELLGVVHAPNEAAAIDAAVKEFGLKEPKRCLAATLCATPMIRRPIAYPPHGGSHFFTAFKPSSISRRNASDRVFFCCLVH